MSSKCFVFDMIDPSVLSVNKAFNWHKNFANSNHYIFPRRIEEYRKLAENAQLLCCKDCAGNLIGLVYFNQDNDEWEIGGLMVEEEYQGFGIGSILMRLALGHLLFEESPLEREENIIIHVHQENQAPRNIISHSLAFHHKRKILVPGDQLPGLKVDENGNVNGDEFHITIPDSIHKLAKWCSEWNGTIKQKIPAEIKLRPHITLELWAKAFMEIAVEAG